MKQTTKIDYMDKGVLAIAGFFWVIGLLIAGSDGSLMPWVNILGLVVFLGSSFLIGSRCQKMDQQHQNLMRYKKSLSRRKHAVNPVRSKPRVYMRYA